MELRATRITDGERLDLKVTEHADVPRLVAELPDGSRRDYIDIGHFLEDWTRVSRAD